MPPALPRIHIPFRAAVAMVWEYTRGKIVEQVRSVAFIILYLVGFQMLVLGTTPDDALRVALGVGLVVLGLAAFLEGLFLGLMPLGERTGVHLPRRFGLGWILAFGLLLGMGSTYAEPAMSALRAAGRGVTAWETPLLYRVLEISPGLLVASIAAGVGVAVSFGMFRFTYGFSIKPFIYILVPVLLALSLWSAFDSNLASLLGIAWDAGAVTTGAVTVPLVLALGIGVSRAAGKREDATGGFGIIMLASAFPVMGVLLLGFVLNPSTPRAAPEEVFFSTEHRAEALRLFPTEAELLQHAFQRGGEAARRAFFEDETAYRQAVSSLASPASRRQLLGELTLADWFQSRASEAERAWLQTPGLSAALPAGPAPPEEIRGFGQVLRGEGLNALRAVLPLTALLVVVLVVFLRERPRHRDEVALGILLALGGMTLFTSGVRLGLAPLGDQVGRPLPRVFRSVPREEGRIVIEAFDPAEVRTGFTADGGQFAFFYLVDRPGEPRPVPFDPNQFDPGSGRYEHIVKRPPLFGPELTLAGIGLVFLFAFGLGYGSTLAEPALGALGRTVEELTVGTIRRKHVVGAVSLGVGIGLMAGVARLLYDIPIIWLLVPPYLLLLPLTRVSEEDFASIAWDCGGVTTGGITVPLVLSLGLGIGGELNVNDGFGILAMASVYPIVTVLLFGLLARARRKQAIRAIEEEEPDE